MSRPLTVGTRAFTTIVASLLVVAGTGLPASARSTVTAESLKSAQTGRPKPVRAAKTPGRKISGPDEQALQQRRQGGDKPTKILLLSKVGGGDEMAAAAVKRGAKIDVVDDKAGYVSAEIRPSAALALEGDNRVEALSLDHEVSLPEPPVSALTKSVAGKHVDAKLSNGYLPNVDINAPSFIRHHPTWDGRGVKIAVLDTGADPTAPGLQTTTTGGRKVTKMADYTNEHSVIGYDVSRDGDTFVFKGLPKIVWKLPDGAAAEPLTFQPISEPGRPDSTDLGNDWNRNGTATDTFGILIVGGDDPRVYIDTNQDHSFADEKPLRDYNDSGDTTQLGTDNPDTPGVRESLTVSAVHCLPLGSEGFNPCGTHSLAFDDTPNPNWDLVWDGNTHGTNVSSIAAGRDLNAGDLHFDGAAPGAEIYAMKVLQSSGSSTTASVGLGLIETAKTHPDVINMSLGSVQFVSTSSGYDTSNTLIDNISRGYGIAFSIAAGNSGPGVGSVATPAGAISAVTVGASISPATYQTNYDRPGIPHEGLLYFSSIGPLDDGGGKPDVVAPGAALAAVPPWFDYPSDIFPTGTPGPGFAMYQGTSMATPEVSGGQALIISAAKATGTAYTPHTLKRALQLGARRLDGYATYEQGAGVIQVDKAFDQLAKLGTTERTIDTQIDAIDPITAKYLLSQGKGYLQRGIDLRNAAVPSDQRYDLNTVDPDAHTYSVSSDQPWLTFDKTQVDAGATTADGSPVGNFTAHTDQDAVAAPGIHSATITLDDPSTPDPADQQVTHTVIVGDPLTADKPLHYTGSGPETGIAAEHTKRFFIDVPAGLPNLDVNVLSPSTDTAGIAMFLTDPIGLQRGAPSTAAFTPGAHGEISWPRPMAGVWEVTLHAREVSTKAIARPASSPVQEFHGYDLTIAPTVVALTPQVWTVTGDAGQPVSTDVSATVDKGVVFAGAATGSPIYRAKTVTKTFPAGPQNRNDTVEGRFTPFTVPAGTTEALVKVNNYDYPNHKTRIEVTYPDGKSGDFEWQSVIDGPEQTIRIENPPVRGLGVKVSTFDLRDSPVDFPYDVTIATTNPSLGNVTVDDAKATHQQGDTWSFHASVTPPANDPGFYHLGYIDVRTENGQSVGTTPVIINRS